MFGISDKITIEHVYWLVKETNVKVSILMSALDDLNTAVSNLTVSVNTEITALNTALANSDSAGIETAVANLNALNTQLQTSVAPTQPVTPPAV